MDSYFECEECGTGCDIQSDTQLCPDCFDHCFGPLVTVRAQDEEGAA